jgi:hypothetical protein
MSAENRLSLQLPVLTTSQGATMFNRVSDTFKHHRFAFDAAHLPLNL